MMPDEKIMRQKRDSEGCYHSSAVDSSPENNMDLSPPNEPVTPAMNADRMILVLPWYLWHILGFELITLMKSALGSRH